MAYSGYFQLINKEDGVYLSVKRINEEHSYPAIDVLIKYCDTKKIEYESVVELKKAYETALSGNNAKISNKPIIPFSGWCEYSIRAENMEMYATMYPPMYGMPEITISEIAGDLRNQKIKYGIKNSAINTMIAENIYYTPVLIAQGKCPVDGYDAEMNYNFKLEADTKPQLNDDGTVDFHKLDIINKVKVGDVVATIKPENPGETGMDIKGSILKPKKVYRKIFKYNKNLKVSEDGLSLISLANGHVSLSGERICVSDEYEIKTDVDNSTGDINFEGNVHIFGNVLSEFKINATGDVIVNGVVEGAEIIAGGNIVLQRGIQGMNKGFLQAGGNITSNFIENATVKAGKDVDTDAILHSKVTASGNINVHGRNGYIIGGYVRAGAQFTAKNIGSQMGTQTIVAAGTDPEMVITVNNLKKQLNKEIEEKQQLQSIINQITKKRQMNGSLDAHKTQLLQKTMKNMILLEGSIKKNREEYQEKKEMIIANEDAAIKVLGAIYPGTKIEIGDNILFVRDRNNYCQYRVINGEVRSTGI